MMTGRPVPGNSKPVIANQVDTDTTNPVCVPLLVEVLAKMAQVLLDAQHLQQHAVIETMSASGKDAQIPNSSPS